MRSITKTEQFDLLNMIAKVEAAAEALLGRTEAYNEALTDLNNAYATIASRAREYYEGRSEKWQASDSGATYRAWVEELESFNYDAIDTDDVVTEIEPLPTKPRLMQTWRPRSIYDPHALPPTGPRVRR